jgi:alkylated DNA nucleotide flippase Atl1
MPRSDEAAAFFHAVYSAVQEIPHGKVTSYGHIAKLVGTRTSNSYISSRLISSSHLSAVYSTDRSPRT